MNAFQSLLDFSKPLDIKLLDRAVSSLLDGSAPPEVQTVLVNFQEHADAWSRVDYILDHSDNVQTKIFALIILENCVKYRWKSLPKNQREGIKGYIVNQIINITSVAANHKSYSIYIRKLNIVLIQMVKQEWPKEWPNFIPDIVSSSKTNESLCANNMQILMLLSEEIFDYSKQDMTQSKIINLKESLNFQFEKIFELCQFVFEKSIDPELICTTLQTLEKFLTWIPLGYIFLTNLLETLSIKFFSHTRLQNYVLQCLCEVSTLQIDNNPEYNQKLAQVFCSVIEQVSQIINSDMNLSEIYANASLTAQAFIRYYSIFVTSFLKYHISILESSNDSTRSSLLQALDTLLHISLIDDIVVFKICLEFWSELVFQLHKIQHQPHSQYVHLTRISGPNPNVSPRLQFYSNVLSRLRLVMIQKMAKPEEVLIVENDEGEWVRETMRDTDSIILYKSMKECLRILTQLDPIDTQDKLVNKLSRQIDGTEWSWNNINTLCWAIGSISGALSEDEEKTFLVRVIKDLLGLCEMKTEKEHKAVIASNIMYVVQKYPRFLITYWKFLKTVVYKLFEFMHEQHPGVQDMACDTFLKIAIKCRKKFVIIQDNEPRPFVDTIIQDISNHISDLNPTQIQTFYEAVGHSLQAESDPNERNRIICQLMSFPNQTWTQIIMNANLNLDTLFDKSTIQLLTSILRTNIRVSDAVGRSFLNQFSKIFFEMLQVYQSFSTRISKEIEKDPNMANHSIIRSMRTVKKEILKLIETFVSKYEHHESVLEMVNRMVEPVLTDYYRSVPSARDSEVLSLMACMIETNGIFLSEMVPKILENVFEVTLQMISKNLEDFPDHRVAFFRLLKAINQHCFKAFFLISKEQFKLVIDSILWAFMHLDIHIADTGLQILLELLNNVENSEAANDFYTTYFLALLRDVFAALTDTFHKIGFSLQASVLNKMFSLVEYGAVTAPLGSDPNMNNHTFLVQYVSGIISSGFPNLSSNQVQSFVNGLFNHENLNDIAMFRQHLQDFLIQIKVFETPSEKQSQQSSQS